MGALSTRNVPFFRFSDVSIQGYKLSEGKTLRIRSLLIIALSVAVAASIGAKPAAKPAPKEDPKPVQAARPANRLLPAPIAVESLYPELTLIQKIPMMTSPGIEPLYSRTDWEIYREFFGKEADELGKKKASDQIAFARTILAAAEKETQRQGLRRLMALRAMALTVRHKEAFPVTVRGLKLFRESIDINIPSHAAGLYAVSEGIWRRSETPKEQRPHYSVLAARSSVQLALQLVEANQLEAAQSALRQVGRHEISLKKDATLKDNVASVRALVSQSIVMMDYMSERYDAMLSGDASAAMTVYLFARFVRQDAELMAEALRRGSQGAVSSLHQRLAEAEKDPLATYAAGETLQTIASNLPEGVLKHRVLYASLQQYRAYMAADETKDERIKRTRARMAIQAVISDGARGKPVIKPFTDEHDVDLSIAEAPGTLPTQPEPIAPPVMVTTAPATAPAARATTAPAPVLKPAPATAPSQSPLDTTPVIKVTPAGGERPAVMPEPVQIERATTLPATIPSIITNAPGMHVPRSEAPEIRVEIPTTGPASMPAVKPIIVEIAPGQGAAQPATRP